MPEIDYRGQKFVVLCKKLGNEETWREGTVLSGEQILAAGKDISIARLLTKKAVRFAHPHEMNATEVRLAEAESPSTQIELGKQKEFISAQQARITELEAKLLDRDQKYIQVQQSNNAQIIAEKDFVINDLSLRNRILTDDNSKLRDENAGLKRDLELATEPAMA